MILNNATEGQTSPSYSVLPHILTDLTTLNPSFLSRPGASAFLPFHHLLKQLVIVQDRLRELKQVPQQIFGAEELDAELPGFEVDAAGDAGKPAVADVVSSRNLDLLAAGELAGPLEVLNQSGTPERFALKLVAVPDPLEPVDEGQPLNKERFAGLEAAEGMQQVDGPAAPDAKDLFYEGAVNHRGGKGAEGVQNLGKVKQPLGLGGRGGISFLSLR